MTNATMTQARADDSGQVTPAITQLPRVHGDVAPSSGVWLDRIAAIFGLFRKDMVFFELLEQMADWAVVSAEQLRRLSRDFPDTAKAIQLLRQTEHESGRLVLAALARLRRAFLTPFDRQDIHRLVKELDAIVDTVATLAKRMPLYHLGAMEPRFAQQADVLLAATQAVRDVIAQLRKTRKLSELRDKLIEIHHHESVGDDNHHAAMSRLFDGTMDPLDVIKWKEVYDFIEQAIDGCEDVGNTLTRLVLKGG